MKKRILVIDEDELILYALAKALKDDGCEVKTAATVNAALETLSHDSYDLCFLNMDFTKIHGRELIQKIRNVCPETRIIIMTADHVNLDELEDNLRDTLTRDAACHLIPKPFNLYEATEMAQKVLAGELTHLNSYQLIGNGFEKRSRRHPRTPWTEKIFFQTSVIHQGVSTRLSVEAEAVDISDTGVGFLTPYPLKESQVISFDEKLGKRIGVVAWSKMLDEENCRVGAKFA